MPSPVFLDANAIIYALDESSTYFEATVRVVQGVLESGAYLCTSHHVIEEVIFVIVRSTDGRITAPQVVEEIAKIPNLVMIEPAAKLEFAERYASLSHEHNMGVNDALLLQLMIDGGIKSLLTYDKKFANKAKLFDINCLL